MILHWFPFVLPGQWTIITTWTVEVVFYQEIIQGYARIHFTGYKELCILLLLINSTADCWEPLLHFYLFFILPSGNIFREVRGPASIWSPRSGRATYSTADRLTVICGGCTARLTVRLSRAEKENSEVEGRVEMLNGWLRPRRCDWMVAQTFWSKKSLKL